MENALPVLLRMHVVAVRLFFCFARVLEMVSPLDLDSEQQRIIGAGSYVLSHGFVVSSLISR